MHGDFKGCPFLGCPDPITEEGEGRRAVVRTIVSMKAIRIYSGRIAQPLQTKIHQLRKESPRL
jgi:hypothetical protein